MSCFERFRLPLRRLLAGVLAAALLPAVPVAAAVPAKAGKLALAEQAPPPGVRLKDVATLQGVRSNSLTGYGLVVGLDGTGDQTAQTPFTAQSTLSMLRQLGVNLPDGTTMQLRNVAAVLVTADLPAFAQPGQRVDVTVASLGNAKSLSGGTLIATPLKGADGATYALAQGNLIVGGAGASAAGSKVQINHLSAGRIPEGATVERGVVNDALSGATLDYMLASNDFATARAVERAINRAKGAGTARAVDGRTVRINAPASAGERVAFLADLEDLALDVPAPAAKVVLNARTGSVVLNGAVTLGPCAVAHGSLTVSVTTTPEVSQPAPLSNGSTVQTERSDISIKQQGGSLMRLPAGARLADVVKALNTLGATPMDLLAILQAMKASGALNADIEVL